MADTNRSERFWREAERAIVEADDVTLDALLREHAWVLRQEPARSTWWGGLSPEVDSDARSIIAREHHFQNWDGLAAHLAAAADESSPVARFETAVDAVVAGDLRKLTRTLDESPGLVRARSTRAHQATLLHYVGANGVEAFRQRTSANVVRVAEALLDSGANIDAVAGIYGGSTTLELAATSIHPVTAGVVEELLAFLLERGASPRPAEAGAWSRHINACHANGRPTGQPEIDPTREPSGENAPRRWRFGAFTASNRS